jgi:hypothetical protein
MMAMRSPGGRVLLVPLGLAPFGLVPLGLGAS